MSLPYSEWMGGRASGYFHLHYLRRLLFRLPLPCLTTAIDYLLGSIVYMSKKQDRLPLIDLYTGVLLNGTMKNSSHMFGTPFLCSWCPLSWHYIFLICYRCKASEKYMKIGRHIFLQYSLDLGTCIDLDGLVFMCRVLVKWSKHSLSD